MCGDVIDIWYELVKERWGREESDEPDKAITEYDKQVCINCLPIETLRLVAAHSST
jgi:hypothetical protein